MAAQGDAGGKAKTMREIPALFNGAMVRAIINDRKTQTRRPLPAVFNSPPSLVHGWLRPGWRLLGQDVPDRWGAQWYGTYPSMVRSPLGKPGDRLWVREAHAWVDYLVGSELEDPVCVAFAADNRAFSFAGKKPVQLDTYGWPWDRMKYRPSIHMPRWAARLFLDVLDVRIERLQDINEEDARAEGFGSRAEFLAAWASIYGAESWAANPWVWVTQFKRVT